MTYGPQHLFDGVFGPMSLVVHERKFNNQDIMLYTVVGSTMVNVQVGCSRSVCGSIWSCYARGRNSLFLLPIEVPHYISLSLMIKTFFVRCTVVS